jgi:uncharacterized protein YjbJ (UPF0337 family)
VTEWRSDRDAAHFGTGGRCVALRFSGARCAREEGPMNRDEIKGKAEKAKGYVKDKAGEILNDPELEAEGEIERASGAVRETVGKAKRKAKDGVEEIAEKLEDEDEE